MGIRGFKPFNINMTVKPQVRRDIMGLSTFMEVIDLEYQRHFTA